MKADWTRGDKTISNYMKKLGRYGVPTYVVYGKNATKGIVLPEIITTSSILEAFRKVNNNGDADVN